MSLSRCSLNRVRRFSAIPHRDIVSKDERMPTYRRRFEPVGNLIQIYRVSQETYSDIALKSQQFTGATALRGKNRSEVRQKVATKVASVNGLLEQVQQR